MIIQFHTILFQIPLQLKDLNPNVLEAQYAVRGPLVIRANEIQADLKKHPEKYNFKKVRFLNIGNPQASSLKPDKYFREYLSLCISPHLLEQDNEQLEAAGYSIESIQRAREFKGNTGAYTHSKGYVEVRKKVAEFIKKRDGYDFDPEDIYLSNGASSAIKDCIQLLAAPNSGFIIPIPQYPLYSASLSLNNIKQYGYHLSEDGWNIDMNELEQIMQRATEDGVRIRAMVIISPNNPAGFLFTHDQIYEIIEFCSKYDLVLFADEVYQSNVYSEIPFVSANKVLHEFEEKTGKKGPTVLSFHSISKGSFGECGLRGGYLATSNAPTFFTNQLYKLASISLCSNTIGQLGVGQMVDPVNPESQDAIIQSMKRRAKVSCDTLNKNKHIKCQTVTGAMYCFPKLEFPQQFIEQAQQEKTQPDEKFCLKLLEDKGICTVPGSGFLQNEGTYHLRMNILEPEEDMELVVQQICDCMDELWQQYEQQ